MNYLSKDFYEAWAEGGRRAYCWINAARQWAISARDYVAAAELDFLTDVLDQKIANEIMEAA